MYESPIEKIVQHIQENLIKQEEDHLMAQITETVGYQINKEELIKALKYDREQYEKGYKDAMSVIEDIKAEITTYKDDKIIHFESNCMIDIVLDIIDKHMRGET